MTNPKMQLNDRYMRVISRVAKIGNNYIDSKQYIFELSNQTLTKRRQPSV